MHSHANIAFCAPLLAVTMPLTANVLVNDPINGATVGLSVHYMATASTTSCTQGVASMGVYVDDVLIYVSHGGTLNTYLTISPGKHETVVEEWDKCGGASFDKLSIKVAAPPSAATPAFSLPSGAYSSPQSVVLSDATPGSAIHYTTDGAVPTISSPLYTSAISVAATETVMAVAVAPGFSTSGMARADYVIATAEGPFIPANAIGASKLQRSPNWRFNHDPGTPGSSDGDMQLVSEPSLSGAAAEFKTSFSDSGGEIYFLAYALDTSSRNFVYDAEVWIAQGGKIGNLEMDMNQVIANGDTVMYGFQCDGDHGTWDFSHNKGSLGVSGITWGHSQAPCDPAKWTTNAWHHVQISYSRDEPGNVTFKGVWLDGVEAPIGVTVPSAKALDWKVGDLLTNFQIDGVGASGNSVVYLDDLTIYRW